MAGGITRALANQRHPRAEPTPRGAANKKCAPYPPARRLEREGVTHHGRSSAARAVRGQPPLFPPVESSASVEDFMWQAPSRWSLTVRPDRLVPAGATAPACEVFVRSRAKNLRDYSMCRPGAAMARLRDGRRRHVRRAAPDWAEELSMRRTTVDLRSALTCGILLVLLGACGTSGSSQGSSATTSKPSASKSKMSPSLEY